MGTGRPWLLPLRIAKRFAVILAAALLVLGNCPPLLVVYPMLSVLMLVCGLRDLAARYY